MTANACHLEAACWTVVRRDTEPFPVLKKSNAHSCSGAGPYTHTVVGETLIDQVFMFKIHTHIPQKTYEDGVGLMTLFGGMISH